MSLHDSTCTLPLRNGARVLVVEVRHYGYCFVRSFVLCGTGAAVS